MEIKDIEKLAKLARIELTDAEKESFAKDLDSILKYVDQIKEVATEDKPAEVGPVYNVMRDDINPYESGVYAEKLRAQFPDREGDFLKVKQIL